MFAFWAFVRFTAAETWKREQILYPDVDTGGIFGRSVSISSKATNRIVIGASYEDDVNHYRAGAVYVFDYDHVKGNYSNLYKKLRSPNTSQVLFNQLGSKMEISADGRRIIAGAPYSYVNVEGSFIREVGAMVIFDLDDNNEWQRKHVIVPSEPEIDQGFGRAVTISSDGKRVAGSYYNKPVVTQFREQQGKVFVAHEKADGTWSETFAIHPPAEWAGKLLKFGADLHFVDDSTLIVGVQLFDQSNMETGTVIYKRSGENTWEREQIVPPPTLEGFTYKAYSPFVSMPINSQSLLGIEASFNANPKDISGALIILEKVDNVWSSKPQQVILAENHSLSGIHFCDSNTFATIGDKTKLFVYKRGPDNKFALEQSLEAIDPSEKKLSFGSDFAWRDDCQVIVVGAMNKEPYESGVQEVIYRNSHAYVFMKTPDNVPDDTDVGLIVGLSVGGGCVVVGCIVGATFLLRKNRRTDSPLEA